MTPGSACNLCNGCRQMLLDLGFSILHGTPTREHNSQTSTVNDANKRPSFSLNRFLALLATTVRAIDQIVHGVPQWTPHTLPSLIKRKMHNWTARIDTSK